MIILLADVNIQGHIEVMAKRMQAEPWIGFWNDLELSLVSFADLGLTPADSDAVVRNRCQAHKAFLLTNNRNDDGPDSLENTIRTCNTPMSLPVFTISDAERLKNEQQYSDRVIWALLEYLLESDNLLGTGRLFFARQGLISLYCPRDTVPCRELAIGTPLGSGRPATVTSWSCM